MPVVRTKEDDGSYTGGPQFALDKGYTGESSFTSCGLIALTPRDKQDCV